MPNHEATRRDAFQCEPTAATRSEIVPPADDDANRFREEKLHMLVQDMHVAAEFVFQRRFILRRLHHRDGSGAGAARQELINLEDNLAHKADQYIRVSSVTALHFLNDRQYSRALQILLDAEAAAQKGTGKRFSFFQPVENSAQVKDSPDGDASSTTCAANASERYQCKDNNNSASTQEVLIVYFAERHERMRSCALAIVENNIGLYHFKITEYSLAEWRISRALAVEELLDVDTIGVTYFNLAQTQYELGRAEVALATITLAEEAIEKTVHEAQTQHSRLRRVCQRQQQQQQQHHHHHHQGQEHEEEGPNGVNVPGLEQRLIQSHLRWRDSVCLLSRVLEFHGDWLQTSGAYKSAMYRYEQSERWLSGLRGRGAAEMARRRKLQERIERCRRCQRRRGCCAIPAQRVRSAGLPPRRVHSVIVTTALPRTVEIIDDAAAATTAATPVRSSARPTPAGTRVRHTDPLVCGPARWCDSGGAAPVSSQGRQLRPHETIAPQKKRNPSEVSEPRPPPFCRPPTAPLTGTCTKRPGHPRHIWQRSRGEDEGAVRVLSLQRCIAVLQAFARARIACLRVLRRWDCVPFSPMSLSRSALSTSSSLSAALGVTSSHSAGSSLAVGPGAKLASALSLSSAVRPRHSRRYRPWDVIVAFVKAAQSVRLVRRWFLCAVRMLSATQQWSNGVNAVTSVNSGSGDVMMRMPIPTKSEISQNSEPSPGCMQRRYKSLLRVWPRSESGLNGKPIYVPAEMAFRAAAEAAATAATASQKRSDDSIDGCIDTEDNGHTNGCENRLSSRVTYMAGPEVYSNLSRLSAHRLSEVLTNGSPGVDVHGKCRGEDENIPLGNDRKPCALWPTKHTSKWPIANGDKNGFMQGSALRDVAASVIQRVWRSRPRDLHYSPHERECAIKIESPKHGAPSRA